MSFSDGEKVRVKNDWPESLGPVHIRTPHYVRGIEGHIERRLGAFPNPEDLAFKRPAPARTLYHVRFNAQAIWPDAKPGDELLIELYEHWLEQP